MNFRISLLVPALLIPVFGWGGWDDLQACSPSLEARDECRVQVLDLRPTQFAVGMRLVGEKVDKISGFDREELEDYLMDHPIPLVIGPAGDFYPIDRHHLSCALHKLDYREGAAEIVVNWSGLSWTEFWDRMDENAWFFPYDEKGRGPRSPENLPRSILGLKDDPYRSLASAALDEGCFKKTSIPYAEFEWAQYFRERVDIGEGEGDFDEALDEALTLCHLPEARDLPGYEPFRKR